MRLSDLVTGDRCVVVKVEDSCFAVRLRDLGFLPGTTVEVGFRAPLGDPVLYHLKGGTMAVRSREAATIEVK